MCVRNKVRDLDTTYSCCIENNKKEELVASVQSDCE